MIGTHHDRFCASEGDGEYFFNNDNFINIMVNILNIFKWWIFLTRNKLLECWLWLTACCANTYNVKVIIKSFLQWPIGEVQLKWRTQRQLSLHWHRAKVEQETIKEASESVKNFFTYRAQWNPSGKPPVTKIVNFQITSESPLTPRNGLVLGKYVSNYWRRGQ